MGKREETITAYYGLVEVVVDKLLFSPPYRNFVFLRDELHSEGVVTLIDAIDNFDSSKEVKLVTYISARIRGTFLNYIRKHKRESLPLRHISNMTVSQNLEELTTDPWKEVEENSFNLIDKYEPKGEVDKAVYHQIIMGSATFQEVADEFGISKAAVKMRKQRLLKNLKREMIKDED